MLTQALLNLEIGIRSANNGYQILILPIELRFLNPWCVMRYRYGHLTVLR